MIISRNIPIFNLFSDALNHSEGALYNYRIFGAVWDEIGARD